MSTPPPYTTAATPAPPPAYTAGPAPSSSPSGGPAPLLRLQIETTGKPWLSLPLPTRPDPIPVYGVIGGSGSLEDTPTYVSLRHSRGSNTSCLVQGGSSSSSSSSSSAETVLSDTTYRFGPGRPPRVRLWLPGRGPSVASRAEAAAAAAAGSSSSSSSSVGTDEDSSSWDSFEIRSAGVFKRAQRFRTARLGEFEWRYASRRERAAAAAAAAAESGEGAAKLDSLLVLERVVRAAPHDDNDDGDDDGAAPAPAPAEERTVVAQLLRGDGGLRAAGSKASSAGNGGRLLVHLDAFAQGARGHGGVGGGKAEREMAAVLAVTTCLCMLKKEVDRRRIQQTAIIAGGAGGS